MAASLLLAASTAVGQDNNADLLAGADARIEKHRKGDAVVRVVDPSGKPVRDAKVRVEMTRHAFRFGSNIFMWGRFKQPEFERLYRERFAEVLNFATLPYYWAWYDARNDQPGHPYREKVATWCRKHAITPKGHPLAWNCGDPPNLPADPDAIFRLQLERIRDCVTRFRGLIEIWDVVNEATHYDRPGFYKRSPKLTKTWDHVGRLPFAKRCFLTARKANPKATLLINDYRTDEKYAELIEQLVDEQGMRLYDTIGIQSHMHFGVWQTEHIWQVCERFAKFGVPLHFTEITVVSGKKPKKGAGAWKTDPRGEEVQARETERFYTMLFSHPAVEAATWWDFSDAGAWKRAPAGWLRKDLTPKPVFHRMKELIKKKWWTTLDGRTDAKGEFRFRGFKGEYKATARSADGRKAEGTFTLKDQGNVVVRMGT